MKLFVYWLQRSDRSQLTFFFSVLLIRFLVVIKWTQYIIGTLQWFPLRRMTKHSAICSRAHPCCASNFNHNKSIRSFWLLLWAFSPHFMYSLREKREFIDIQTLLLNQLLSTDFLMYHIFQNSWKLIQCDACGKNKSLLAEALDT